ncbi:MAG: PhoP regulatory network YrbL family protein [Hyphomicrobiales bacterium]|nr:PhoP regulatory network YrbL family protein [Hyphomicrobiales bacterium]
MDEDILQVERPIASGRYRRVYIHPHDDSKLIKVEWETERGRANKPLSELTKIRRAFRSMLSSNYMLTGHDREMLGIAELRRKQLSDNPFFVKFYGEVQTNIGRGLIFQRITNFPEGKIYKLSDYLEENNQIKDINLKNSIASYFDLLFKNSLYIYGGEKENIGIIRDEYGKLAVKIFDFKLYTRKALLKLSSAKRYAKINIELQRKRALGL